MDTDVNQDLVRNCLIIEDSNFDQKMMERVVQRTEGSFNVQVVSTLSDARRVLAEEPVSIILLDNNLPDGKGANFALELSKDQNLSDIPVIIVSDWPSPFMWQKAQLAGVSSVVNKSEFNSELILAALPASPVMH
ncbi:MAG: response regulator [Arenibacterium sp.]